MFFGFKYALHMQRAALRSGAGGGGGANTREPEVVIVPGAGHAVHLEAPEALVLPLLRFVLRARR